MSEIIDYVVRDESTGAIIGNGSCVDTDLELQAEAGQVAEINTGGWNDRDHRFNKSSGTYEAKLPDDRLDRAAIRGEISRQRDQLEVAPITVNGHYMDCDEKSDKRLSETLDAWDALGLTSIDWTMADDTEVTFDKAGLQALYDAMRIARAARAGLLHIKAREFKADPMITLRDIEPENW